MRPNPLLLLTLLSKTTTTAWATNTTPQSPLTPPNTCLSLTGGSANTNFEACCSSSQKSGRGTVDGVEFTYTCQQWATPYAAKPVVAASARECAQLCAAAGKDCPAAAWMARGQCYTITAAGYSVRPLKGILLLEKVGEVVTEEPVVGGGGGESGGCDEVKAECEKVKTEQVAQCEKEKTALVESEKAQCVKEQTGQCDKVKTEQAAQCEKDKAALVESEKAQCDKVKTEQCDKMKTEQAAQCEKDKAALVESEKAQCAKEQTGQCDKMKTEQAAQCEKDKAALVESEKAQCAKEKTTLTEDAQKQCAAEKEQLQKALDEANQKLKELQTGGGGGDSAGSATSPTNEALVADIARENFSSICPKFAGKTFITVDKQGYKHEWMLYCHTGVSGASTPSYNWSCHTQNIIQLLQEQQDRSDFKALWVNTANVCTPWHGGYVGVGTAFGNHHLVLPTRQPWK
ncbi:uncharacterized protein BO97DRAFT_46365 [Aspergillus homomorphus CBS 101889]|uniref:Apple domain-containing protein n=1 Tax=Aspergillus homomorphus (strain CBS 101889) TaxID=1450537 RepID=A0A395I029_ASPHC|nr:hypothetical protein BO97DRAFT_46365 [Aspergillus homomorphus CBS 101889]RAL13287.1 hypothetical protein BO97DRAFT_46365 [Aspergillus homomorphus CBS 101889]